MGTSAMPVTSRMRSTTRKENEKKPSKKQQTQPPKPIQHQAEKEFCGWFTLDIKDDILIRIHAKEAISPQSGKKFMFHQPADRDG